MAAPTEDLAFDFFEAVQVQAKEGPSWGCSYEAIAMGPKPLAQAY